MFLRAHATRRHSGSILALRCFHDGQQRAHTSRDVFVVIIDGSKPNATLRGEWNDLGGHVALSIPVDQCHGEKRRVCCIQKCSRHIKLLHGTPLVTGQVFIFVEYTDSLAEECCYIFECIFEIHLDRMPFCIESGQVNTIGKVFLINHHVFHAAKESSVIMLHSHDPPLWIEKSLGLTARESPLPESVLLPCFLAGDFDCSEKADQLIER